MVYRKTWVKRRRAAGDAGLAAHDELASVAAPIVDK